MKKLASANCLPAAHCYLLPHITRIWSDKYLSCDVIMHMDISTLQYLRLSLRSHVPARSIGIDPKEAQTDGKKVHRSTNDRYLASICRYCTRGVWSIAIWIISILIFWCVLEIAMRCRRVNRICKIFIMRHSASCLLSSSAVVYILHP